MDRSEQPIAPNVLSEEDIAIVDGRLVGLIGAAPNAYMLMRPDLTIAGCNEAYVTAIGRSRETFVGQGVFEAFPSTPGSESDRLLRRSLDRVLHSNKTDHIAFIPYPVGDPGEEPTMRYWSATHVPIIGRDGSLRYILQHTADITELMAQTAGAGRGAILEAGILMRANQVQAESERLRNLFDDSPGFVAIMRGPDHVFEIANAAYRRLVGDRALYGLAVREALPEVVEQGFVALLDQVYRTGEPYVGRGVSVMLQQAPGLPREERLVDFAYQPLRDAAGAIQGIFVQGVDVTEQQRTEQRMATIMRESVHRIKNTLAMAQAVVSATLRTASDIQDARKNILSRLSALAVSQPALIEGRLAPSDIALVVAAVMRPHVDLFGRIETSGPSAEIEPSAAQGLALILHELATNAIKYGALSADTGTVSIAWTVLEDERRVELLWQERGGPTVRNGETKGFGTTLIERALPRSSGNHVALVFAPAGVECRISVALRRDGSGVN